MVDVIKALLALALYLGFGPMLGIWLAENRKAQRYVFALMLFMTSWIPGKFTLMLGSIETYRGHAKGFEISLIEVLSIALIVAISKKRPAGSKRLPPGAIWYLIWCVAGLYSITAAWESSYVLMALCRFSKGILMFMAAALYVRDDEDLRWVLRGIAVAIILQALVCLKMRYVDGYFQVKGWFEHQNPMAMWAYLGSFPLIAAALHKDIKGAMLLLCLAGAGAAGVCELVSVSRASLAAYAAGAAVLVMFAWIRSPGIRVATFTAMGACGAVLVVGFAMNSFKARQKEASDRQTDVVDDLRDTMNKQSAAMMHDHPWTGIGWNNFGIANSRPRGAQYSQILEEWDKSRGFAVYEENYLANPLTESLYWLWLAELGYPGFVTFLIFELITVWCALRCWLYYKKTFFGAFAGALFVGLTICYIHGTVERILTQTKNLSEWLLFAGLASGMEMMRREAKRRDVKRVR